MILFEEVFPIGQIMKPHGVNGEMSFTFTSDVFDNEDFEYFVIEMDGILVPFYIAGYRFKTNESGLLQLDGINSEAEARELIGKTLYAPKKYLGEVEDDEIELDYFVGFQLIDSTHGLIGTIKEIDKTTENTLFVIDKENDELLIPIGEDYVTDIDHDKRILTVELPEGLLDL